MTPSPNPCIHCYQTQDKHPSQQLRGECNFICTSFTPQKAHTLKQGCKLCEVKGCDNFSCATCYPHNHKESCQKKGIHTCSNPSSHKESQSHLMPNKKDTPESRERTERVNSSTVTSSKSGTSILTAEDDNVKWIHEKVWESLLRLPFIHAIPITRMKSVDKLISAHEQAMKDKDKLYDELYEIYTDTETKVATLKDEIRSLNIMLCHRDEYIENIENKLLSRRTELEKGCGAWYMSTGISREKKDSYCNPQRLCDKCRNNRELLNSLIRDIK